VTGSTPVPASTIAIGLYVPGAGGSITRAGTIASLERGKVENALLGGKPGGKVLADVRFGAPEQPRLPAAYVTLPPPGEHHNTRRYLVVIAAPGYSGILTSSSTRIRGLVSVADIAPTLVALQEGRSPPIRSKPDADPRDDLDTLDRRLSHVHRDRGWTLAAVALTLLGLGLLWPRAGVLVGAAAVSVSLWLAATGTTRFWEVLLWMTIATVALAYLASLERRVMPVAVALFFTAFLLVLTLSPLWNSLGVLGARPDGGGRFYGIGNQVETLVLLPLIAGVVAGGLVWLVPLGALALVTVAWSKAGADGGGLVVFAVALAVLFLRLRRAPLTWRVAALAGAGVVALAFALVGIDAALGGSSHVTHAVGSGSFVGDFGHRLHLSWASATKSAYNIAFFLASVAGLVWIGTRAPRRPGVDALLVALAVSLLVNDTPVDVIGLGALGCLALWRFESVDSRPMRRGALIAVCVCAVLGLVGCGSQGVGSTTPQTVVGTVAKEPPGKAIFINQGCGACHTYTPAGPEANGNIGPDLDKLAQYAKQAKQPLDTFVHDSIVDPNKYVQPGYPKNVMPKSYKSLPAGDLKDLVDFLAKPQG
jgi:cytochrome c551/c552